MLENIPWQSSLPLLGGGALRTAKFIVAALLGYPIKFLVKTAEGRRPGYVHEVGSCLLMCFGGFLKQLCHWKPPLRKSLKAPPLYSLLLHKEDSNQIQEEPLRCTYYPRDIRTSDLHLYSLSPSLQILLGSRGSGTQDKFTLVASVEWRQKSLRCRTQPRSKNQVWSQAAQPRVRWVCF